MSLTILIDLDDTLLINDINKFLPHYLKALSKHLANRVKPEILTSKLLAATQVMLSNMLPTRTLEETFDAAFYPAIGVPKPDLIDPLTEFYRDVFGSLSYLTQPNPDTEALFNYLQASQHTSAIATNPLFPRMAIDHRVRWCGLDPETRVFSAITSYETYHFAKPNPAFLYEVVAKMGFPNQNTVMIGNDLKDDLLPAIQLGMPVFWVNGDSDLPPNAHPLSRVGKLGEAIHWIERVDAEITPYEITQPVGLAAVLRSTAAFIDTLSRSIQGLTPEQPLKNHEGILDTLCHMRDVEADINRPHILSMLEQNNPFLTGHNTDLWRQERDYEHQDVIQVCQQFIRGRIDLINLLENLTPEKWERSARHSFFGPTTLRELVGFIGIHDRNHIRLLFGGSVDASKKV